MAIHGTLPSRSAQRRSASHSKCYRCKCREQDTVSGSNTDVIKSHAALRQVSIPPTAAAKVKSAVREHRHFRGLEDQMGQFSGRPQS